MYNEVFEVSVLSVVIVGVVASVLATLAWHVFRRTSVRRLFGALAIFVVVGTLYHVLLLVFRERPIPIGSTAAMDVQIVRSFMYTAVAACVLLTAYFNRDVTGVYTE
ncbi:MAG: hypothetical protein ABEJ28_04815 [Salinigranum sp.]